MRALLAVGVVAALAVGVRSAQARGRAEGRRHRARLHAAGDRRQDAQAVGLSGASRRSSSPGSRRRSRRAARSSASRWRRTATRSGSTTSRTSWRASTRSREQVRKARATLRAWWRPNVREGADFPLLSDPTKEMATAYGVLNARGMANRWTFYIDKNGKIAHDRQGRAARRRPPRT